MRMLILSFLNSVSGVVERRYIGEVYSDIVGRGYTGDGWAISNGDTVY